MPSYWYRVPGKKLLPKLYSITFIRKTGSGRTLHGITLTTGSIILSLLEACDINCNSIFYPSSPIDLKTEAMNPRSALLLCINSIRIGNSLLFSEVPARWLSLLRMERMIYFYLPFPFEFTRSSIKVGTNNYPITSSVRDKWSRIIVGSSLKSCRAR